MLNKPKNKPVSLVGRMLAILAVLSLIIPQAARASAQFEPFPVFKPMSNHSSNIIGKVAPEETLSALEQAALRADRIDRLNSYFKERDMPLAGYGDEFLTAADKCDIDWRLVPAIGVRESSGGKHLLNNNPFGWGSAKIKFKNFNEAIDVVTENLCGLDADTDQYYKDTTTYEKLWAYNGTVLHSYPKEVIAIMNMF